MTTWPLWIEITMAGSIYVVSLLFLVIAVWNPHPNLQFPPFNSQLFLAYLGAAFLGLSYIVGFVAHRSIQVLFDKFRAKTSRSDELDCLETLWQLGSARVQRELDFQFTQLALLRSLLFSVPCLAVAVGIWRFFTACRLLAAWRQSSNKNVCTFWHCLPHLLDFLPSFLHWFSFVVIFLVLYLLVYCAFRRQDRQYEDVWTKAFKNIGKLSGPAEAFVTVKGIRFGEADGNTTLTFGGIKIDPPLVRLDKLIPRISSVNTENGILVTITGLNLGDNRGESTVTYNGRAPQAVTWKSLSLEVLIPKNETCDPTKVRADVEIDVSSTQSTEPHYKIKLTCPE